MPATHRAEVMTVNEPVPSSSTRASTPRSRHAASRTARAACLSVGSASSAWVSLATSRSSAA